MESNKEGVAILNKLIAEFMGCTHIFQNIAGHWRGSFTGEEDDHLDLPEYDLDWNELIPVLEKIASLGNLYRYKINNGHTTIHNSQGAIFQVVNTDPKKATYEAVVEFIKWYNSQSK